MSFASFPAEIEQRMRRERGRDRGGKVFESENEFCRRSVAQKWRRGADFGRFDKGKSFEAAALGERVISSK